MTGYGAPFGRGGGNGGARGYFGSDGGRKDSFGYRFGGEGGNSYGAEPRGQDWYGLERREERSYGGRPDREYESGIGRQREMGYPSGYRRAEYPSMYSGEDVHYHPAPARERAYDYPSGYREQVDYSPRVDDRGHRGPWRGSEIGNDWGAIPYNDERDRDGGCRSSREIGPRYNDRGRQYKGDRGLDSRDSRERGAGYDRYEQRPSRRSRSPRTSPRRNNGPPRRERSRPVQVHRMGPRKDREDKVGNLNAAQSKTNAAVRIIIGHWLEEQLEGYQSVTPPKNWHIHPSVTRGYMAEHQLPVDEKVIYDMKDAGQSTAQYLHKSWQRSKKAVHDHWTQFGGVRAPPLDFFLQGPDEELEDHRPTSPTKATTPKAIPNPIPLWLVAEGLGPQEMVVVGDGDGDSDNHDTGRKEEDRCAEPRAEAEDISQDDDQSQEGQERSNGDGIQDGNDEESEDEPFSKDMWPDSDNDIHQQDQNGGERDSEDNNVDESAKGHLHKQYHAGRTAWPEYHTCQRLGLPLSDGASGKRTNFDRAQLRAIIDKWKANEGTSPGIFNNLFVHEDVPSLLMVCTRFSSTHYDQAKVARDELHPVTKNVILRDLLPQLQHCRVVDIIGVKLQLTRQWCFTGSKEKQNLARLAKWDANKNPFALGNIRFIEAIREHAETGSRRVYIALNGGDGWSSVMSEWEALIRKFPEITFVLIFGVRPRNIDFDRTGWSPLLEGRVWGFFELAKMVRVHYKEEVDEMYRLMVEDMIDDGTRRKEGEPLKKRGRNAMPKT